MYKRQGFIGKDAEIRSFETASVARFSIAVSRADKTGEELSLIHIWGRENILLSATFWQVPQKVAKTLWVTGNPINLQMCIRDRS